MPQDPCPKTTQLHPTSRVVDGWIPLKGVGKSIDIRVYRKGIGNQAPPREMRFACTVIILIAHNWVTYSGHGVQVVISDGNKCCFSCLLSSNQLL